MKKIISLCMAFIMVVSLVPSGVVKADTESDVAMAKECIDTIVAAAPTVQEYKFSEELAESVNTLERVLRDITSATALETLDAYVAEKTTVVLDKEDGETGEEGDEETGGEEEEPELYTYYTSVLEFSVDYSDAQKEALKKLAEPIEKKIKAMLDAPLTKKNYEAAQKAYDEVSRYIQDSVNADDVNSLNQLRELLTLAERADLAFSRITIPTKNTDADEFEFFMKDYEAAKAAYGLYDSKFANLKPKYYVCLQKDSKNSLLENYITYAKASYHARVENAYDKLGSYDSFSPEVKEKMQDLADAVENGQESEFQISVYDYYRGEDIQFILDQYKHMTELEEMMALIPESPTNKTELTTALRAYRYYTEDLTEHEKELVPEEYLTRLNNAVLMNTNSEDVIQAILDIGVVTSEEEYADYLERYNKAYKAYRLFVNKYSGLSDIASLITNVEVLDNSTEVIEIIKSIRQIEETEDALMCSKRLQMESILSAIERLTDEKKAAIFNRQNLKEIYEDATSADNLRKKVNEIVSDHTLLDEQYVQEICDEYETLSDKAKRYFGNDYVKKIQTIQRDLEALNINKALRVSSMIAQISSVRVSSKAEIECARKAYDELTDKQKTYVNNYDVLEEAEKQYAKLDVSVEKATITMTDAFIYSGAAITPSVIIRMNGVTLSQNLDYRLTYSSNVKVGTAKVTIYGIGAYSGIVTRNFTIQPCPVMGAALIGMASQYTYTGNGIEPQVEVGLNGRKLNRDVDYTISYKNNVNAGLATIVVTGKGNYSGSAQSYFTIKKISMSKASLSGVKKKYKKTGKAIKPAVKVRVSGTLLKKNRDYKVSYKKNKKKGKATITITGINNYSGTRKITFKIV